MIKNVYKIILMVFLLTPQYIHAASVDLSTSSQSYNKQEQFALFVSLDTEKQNFNGVEGKISYSNKNFKFIRIDDSKSIISNWIDYPEGKDGEISFSGIIPAGFNSTLDPVSGERNIGNIFTVIFEPIDSGISNIKIDNLNLALNDGLGTLVSPRDTNLAINISQKQNQKEYGIEEDNINPILNYEIVKEEIINNGMYTLVFSAQDKESGIKGVYIKEKKNLDWSKVESPYLLGDQKRKGIILIRVEDNFGNTTNIKIYPPIFKFIAYSQVTYIAIFAIVLVVLFRRYAKKKK